MRLILIIALIKSSIKVLDYNSEVLVAIIYIDVIGTYSYIYSLSHDCQ